jgi:hypothetical protein
MAVFSTLDRLHIKVIGRKIRQYFHTKKTPSVPDAKAQPTNDATGPKETHHADDTQVEDGTEEPLVHVASGEGSQTSPLLRLPPELRAMIFEMALVRPAGINLRARDLAGWVSTHERRNGYLLFDRAGPPGMPAISVNTTILRALGFMATCRQIRSDFTSGLLRLNDVNVHDVDYRRVKEQNSGITRIIPFSRDAPSLFNVSSGRVVLWENWDGHDFAIYEERRRAGKTPARRIDGLDEALSEYARAIQPFQLFIGLSMKFHHLAVWEDKCLCKQDASAYMSDCRRVQCVVPLGDRVEARRLVDKAIDRRLDLIRRHYLHRLCYVRAMRRKLESGLVVARQYMREEVDRICYAQTEVSEVNGEKGRLAVL